MALSVSRTDHNWRQLCRKLECERDEAKELAKQMSESNQVLMADVRHYQQLAETPLSYNELHLKLALDEVAKMAREFKQERDEAREEIENLKASLIHTCHDQCRRPMCVLRRERDEAKKTAVMLAGELAAARRDLILAKREAK